MRIYEVYVNDFVVYSGKSQEQALVQFKKNYSMGVESFGEDCDIIEHKGHKGITWRNGGKVVLHIGYEEMTEYE